MTLTLPVSQKKIKYRPFVIKEQKSLLLAQESNDADAILETIKSVIASCTNGTMDFQTVPTADLAYFFVHLRIASVGPDVRLQLKCIHCNEPNTISFSLNDVKVDTDNVITEVKITDEIGIRFRLPTVDDAISSSTSDNRSLKMLYNLIDCVYDADSVYSKSDYTEEEFNDWIESFNDSQVERISNFVNSIPDLRHTLDFNCVSCNEHQSRLLEGLHNFFRLDVDS